MYFKLIDATVVSKFLYLLLLSPCSLFSVSGQPQAQTKQFLTQNDIISHERMKIWSKDHLPQLATFRVLNRFFIEKLVRDPAKFILSPGQLWPYPADLWVMQCSSWLSYIWDRIVNSMQLTQYSSHMVLYHKLHSGYGYMHDITPGAYQSNLAHMRKLEDIDRVNTPEWRLAAFYTAISLYHSAEDDRLLVDVLETLCFETTLSSYPCDDIYAVDAWKTMIRSLLISSYLRLGEENSCHMKNCSQPMKSNALRMKSYALNSHQAIKYLEVELQAIPANIGAKWLLNMAYMTLGSYPDNVPDEYLIDPKLFESDYDIQTYDNIEGYLGIDTYSGRGSGIIDDFVGNDGLKDIFYCSQGYDHDQIRLYKNLGDGKFYDITAEAGLIDINGGINCRHADYNNDGHLDIFIMRGGGGSDLFSKHMNSIIRNNGDDTFTDITFKSSLISLGNSYSMDFGDVNRDGMLDIFISYDDIPCELWLNMDNDTFINIANHVIHDCGHVKGVTFTDYNDDMWPDIMISRYGMPDMMLRNDGQYDGAEKWSYSDVSEEVGLHIHDGDVRYSYATSSFDVDQDGTLDLIVAGYLEEGPDAICWSYTNESYDIHTLLHSDNTGSGQKKLTRVYLNRNGHYEEVGADAGLQHHIMSMGMNYGDVDNDGHLDIYFGTGGADIRSRQPNRMYHNDLHRSGRYHDITTAGSFGHMQQGNGVSFADIDNDGDVDIYSQTGGIYDADFAHDRIYLNPGHHDHHYIKVDLQGILTNAKAIGSRIFIYTIDDHGNEGYHHHTMSTGASYGSNAIEAHIGIGRATEIMRMVIWWQRTGDKQVFYNIPIDTKIRIVEGKDAYMVVNEPTFTIDKLTITGQ